MGVQTMRPWPRATALTVGVLILVPACGLGTDQAGKVGPGQQRTASTDTPGVAVTPRGPQPAGMRLATGKYFSMYVPVTLDEKTYPVFADEQLVDFRHPSPRAFMNARVSAHISPMRTAIQQSDAVEDEKEGSGVKDFTRSTVKWPGADSAILMQWTVTFPGDGGTYEQSRYRHLITQVNDHLVVSLFATAPSREFDSAAGLAKSFESFRPHA